MLPLPNTMHPYWNATLECVCVWLFQMRSHVRMSEGRRNREKRPKMRLPWRKVCNICIYVCSGGGQRGRTHCGAAVRVITISHIVKCTNAWICFKGFMGSESVCVFVQENLFANQYFGIGFGGDDDAGVEINRAVVVRPLFGVNRRRFLREVCPCDDGDGVCVQLLYDAHTHIWILPAQQICTVCVEWFMVRAQCRRDRTTGRVWAICVFATSYATTFKDICILGKSYAMYVCYSVCIRIVHSRSRDMYVENRRSQSDTQNHNVQMFP